MIKTVSDLRRALDAFPDDMPVVCPRYPYYMHLSPEVEEVTLIDGTAVTALRMSHGQVMTMVPDNLRDDAYQDRILKLQTKFRIENELREFKRLKSLNDRGLL